MLTEAEEAALDAEKAAKAGAETTSGAAAPAGDSPAIEVAQFPLATQIRLTHADECDAKGKEVQSAKFNWLGLREEAKGAKADYLKLLNELESLTARGPDRQGRLALSDAAETPAATGDDSVPSAAAVDLSWREWPIAKLVETKLVTVKQCEKLEGAGLSTLGKLQDKWSKDGAELGIKGVGPETEAKYADAWVALAALYPQMNGQPVAKPAEPAATPVVVPPPAEPPADPFADEAADEAETTRESVADDAPEVEAEPEVESEPEASDPFADEDDDYAGEGPGPDEFDDED